MGEHIGPKYRYEYSESYYTRALKDYQDHVQNVTVRMPDWLFFGGSGLCIVLAIVSGVFIDTVWVFAGFAGVAITILIFGIEDSKRLAQQRDMLFRTLEQEAESFCMHMVRGQTGVTVSPKAISLGLINLSIDTSDMRCYFDLYGATFMFDCNTKMFWHAEHTDFERKNESPFLPDVAQAAASNFQASVDKLG